MRQTLLGIAKSMAGAGLAALGVVILYDDLHTAAVQLDHLLGDIGGQAVGVVPIAILAADRVTRTYASGHPRFVEIFTQHLLVSCWPLLLIIVGTAWFRDDGTDCGIKEGACLPQQDSFSEKSVVHVDFSTYENSNSGPTSNDKEMKRCDS